MSDPPPSFRIPPAPPGKRKGIPLYGFVFIGFFVLIVGYFVVMLIYLLWDMNKRYKASVSNNIYIYNLRIVATDSLYTYYFKITNNTKSTFVGRIELQFEGDTVPNSYNQTIQIDTLPSNESSQFEFTIPKAPSSIDPDDGLHTYTWSALRASDSKMISGGEGKVVEEVEGSNH